MYRTAFEYATGKSKNEHCHVATSRGGQQPSDNRTLIRSGEARLAGWSRSMLYLGFSILPRSVFWSADLNGRSDNTDVIRLNDKDEGTIVDTPHRLYCIRDLGHLGSSNRQLPDCPGRSAKLVRLWLATVFCD